MNEQSYFPEEARLGRVSPVGMSLISSFSTSFLDSYSSH